MTQKGDAMSEWEEFLSDLQNNRNVVVMGDEASVDKLSNALSKEIGGEIKASPIGGGEWVLDVDCSGDADCPDLAEDIL